VILSKTAVKVLGAELYAAAVQHFNEICGCLCGSSCMQGEESSADEYGSDDFFKYAGAIEEATKRQSEADAQFREMLLKLDVSNDARKWSDAMQLLVLRLIRLRDCILG